MNPKTALIKTGEVVNLTCSSEDAGNSQLQWFKKGRDDSKVALPSSQTAVLKNYQTDIIKAVLMIKNAGINDSAVYICLLTHGKQNRSDFVKLQVKGE